MSIIVDNDTRLVVQGLTGSEGRFHGLRNRAYGTNLVAGVTPGKGGQDVEGVPVFHTVAESVSEQGANTAMIFVPAPFAADAVYEAVDAGITTVICITEGVPAHDMLRIHSYVQGRGVTLIGPNCPGALSPGKVVVDMSSISPIATKDFAARITAMGCDYLDAPVSGGEVGAKAASLTIMVGGSEAVFAKLEPVFRLMGKNVTLVGGNGDGQTTKVANQIIVALTIEAVAEGLLFASKAGADPAKVRQALMGGLATSRILEVHGERMIKRTFDPGFRIELHQKDLNLALQGARSLGVSLPNTATCQELFNAACAAGGAAWDHSAMVRVLERLANHEVGSTPDGA